MKVYSSSSKNNALDQYVGKDIWVKVYYLDYDDEIIYARITKKVGDEYWFNAYFPDDSIVDYDSEQELIDEVMGGDITGSLKLARPVKTLTTDDLIVKIKQDLARYY